MNFRIKKVLKSGNGTTVCPAIGLYNCLEAVSKKNPVACLGTFSLPLACENISGLFWHSRHYEHMETETLASAS